jgi:hypothetical protein
MGFSWINYYDLTDREYRRILGARQQRGSGAAANVGKKVPLPVNVPLPRPRRPPPGMSAGVIVYRGPAPVTFEPDGFTSVKNGELVVKATFTQPGTYVLRAIASDGMLRTFNDFTMTVGDP